MATAVKKNVCLIVIDGWGISDEIKGEHSIESTTDRVSSGQVSSCVRGVGFACK